MKYYIIYLNGKPYTACQDGGRVPSTEAEQEFWQRIQRLEMVLAHVQVRLGHTIDELVVGLGEPNNG